MRKDINIRDQNIHKKQVGTPIITLKVPRKVQLELNPKKRTNIRNIKVVLKRPYYALASFQKLETFSPAAFQVEPFPQKFIRDLGSQVYIYAKYM